jgi:hypothetical protein
VISDGQIPVEEEHLVERLQQIPRIVPLQVVGLAGKIGGNGQARGSRGSGNLSSIAGKGEREGIMKVEASNLILFARIVEEGSPSPVQEA